MLEERAEFYRAALAAKPLLPATNAALRTFDGGRGLRYKMRVPPDQAALHDLVRIAHAIASKTNSPAAYEASMRTELATLMTNKPVYWSKLWPAGMAMSQFILQQPNISAGKSVLEIGAGLGCGAVCAALAGANMVVATDIEQKGLEFCMQSAVDNGIPQSRFRTQRWDWNGPPDGLGGPFDVVLAGGSARTASTICSMASSPALTLPSSPQESRRRSAACTAASRAA